MDDVIRNIFKKNGISEPFVKIASKGIANDIYITSNFVLKIPTDHPEANSDAFTESIAAPLANQHGIKTPKLICFDDSYSLIKKPYSIWERIHGYSLGEITNYDCLYNSWREIGFELGKLHVSIKNCDDPKGWLDNPDRDYTKTMLIQKLLKYETKSQYLKELVENKCTQNIFLYKKCFVHGDTNIYNFLCSKADRLLSIIDWGDSGWGDPSIDFYMIPMSVLDIVLDGYLEVARTIFDNDFIYRIILDKVWIAIEERQDLSSLENKIIELENKLLEKL